MLTSAKKNLANRRIVRLFIERRLRRRRSFSNFEFKNKKSKRSKSNESNESIRLESLERAI